MEAFLQRLNDACCLIGWHCWFEGQDRKHTRYCDNCGRMEKLREWSVTIQGRKWERVKE